MNYDKDYDFDEYYGTTLAEDRKALKEDIEHLYFIGVGILMCALSDWRAAIIGAVATVGVRDFLRSLERRRRK